MGSLDIAELTGKRHADVLRDIRVMLEALGDASSFAGIYRDTRNRAKPCFNLPRAETMILVSGYSIPLRAAIVRRFDAYEAPAAQPQPVPGMEQLMGAMTALMQGFVQVVAAKAPEHRSSTL